LIGQPQYKQLYFKVFYFLQVLERLTHLSRVWRVLPEETHHQAMGALLDTLCEHVTAGVLELTDISEDEVRAQSY
jgi:hypothetical protein